MQLYLIRSMSYVSSEIIGFVADFFLTLRLPIGRNGGREGIEPLGLGGFDGFGGFGFPLF